MTDFMRWLYVHYIQPQIKDQDFTGYETSLSLLDSTLDQDLRTQYERALEFYSSNAFLLGLRTGAGLAHTLGSSQSSQASFGSIHPSI